MSLIQLIRYSTVLYLCSSTWWHSILDSADNTMPKLIEVQLGSEKLETNIQYIIEFGLNHILS